MKLCIKRGGLGNITYIINISKTDATKLNWINEDGTTKELKKTIKKNKLIIEEKGQE